MRYVIVSVLALLVALPASAQDNTPGIEEELQALVQAATRLVDSLERQETSQLSDRELLQVQVGVRLLDIRVRQQEAYQRRLERLDDREQRLTGSIASNQVRVDNFDRQIAETGDEATKVELDSARAVRMVYLKNQQNELEHLSQRRTEIENRLMEGERSVLQIEDLVQDWVDELQDSSGK